MFNCLVIEKIKTSKCVIGIGMKALEILVVWVPGAGW